MKTFVFFIVLALIASCTSYKRERFSYPNSEKDTWINSYKYEAFYGCIREGLGNDSLRIILSNKDLFRPNMDMDFVTVDKARAFGKVIAKAMPPPVIKVDRGEEELRNRNFISYSCLNYFASRELDSVARKEYEIYKAFKKN